jgi:hypothetical protein
MNDILLRKLIKEILKIDMSNINTSNNGDLKQNQDYTNIDTTYDYIKNKANKTYTLGNKPLVFGFDPNNPLYRNKSDDKFILSGKEIPIISPWKLPEKLSIFDQGYTHEFPRNTKNYSGKSFDTGPLIPLKILKHPNDPELQHISLQHKETVDQVLTYSAQIAAKKIKSKGLGKIDLIIVPQSSSNFAFDFAQRTGSLIGVNKIINDAVTKDFSNARIRMPDDPSEETRELISKEQDKLLKKQNDLTYGVGPRAKIHTFGKKSVRRYLINWLKLSDSAKIELKDFVDQNDIVNAIIIDDSHGEKATLVDTAMEIYYSFPTINIVAAVTMFNEP